LLFSFFVLVCFSPLLLFIALAILLSDGAPVFYGHKRQGRGGRTFYCWKFRTMRKNADSMVQSLQESNLCDGPQVLIKNDPRVTPIGNILRNTQLDELPQFFNVLLGQMSIVGPRPSPNDENQLCPAWRDVRLSVRPGITGLWQLKRTRQPGEDFQEWIRFDIEYVRRASMKTDLSILFATTWSFINGRLRRGNDTKI
jgi:lipopolysaccharide/colanic/teichoic acid biosynthesis glycosyltransferase